MNKKEKNYPDWVEKCHIKGTSIKKINDNYYLYRVTSKNVEGKNYPVSIQKYIGKITEDGLIEPEKISFTPGIDKIIMLGTLITEIETKDKKIINSIPVVEINKCYYCGYISKSTIKLIQKYFHYENGRIWR